VIEEEENLKITRLKEGAIKAAAAADEKKLKNH